MTQRLPTPKFTPGSTLDTHKLSDLTPEENAQYEERVATAKRKVEPEAQRVRDVYETRESKTLAKERRVSEDEAREIVRQRVEGGELHPDDILMFDRLGRVPVRDVICNLRRYDDEALADPLEPEQGQGKAKCFANLPGGVPIIHSFAHGGRSFYFPIEAIEQALFDPNVLSTYLTKMERTSGQGVETPGEIPEGEAAAKPAGEAPKESDPPKKPAATLEWPKKVLPIENPHREPFPGGVFPPWVENWIAAVAESYQVPPDFPALTALAMIATGAQRVAEIELKADWNEVLTVQVAIIAESGDRKTAAETPCVTPVWDLEARQREETWLERTMPIRLTQVGPLGPDPAPCWSFSSSSPVSRPVPATRSGSVGRRMPVLRCCRWSVASSSPPRVLECRHPVSLTAGRDLYAGASEFRENRQPVLTG